jgi:tRNA(Ile)-lysidine synthase
MPSSLLAPRHPMPQALSPIPSSADWQVHVQQEFAAHLADIQTIAVAVSGGPDSMALCLLLHAWAKPQRKTIAALIIDHGLRPESMAEAAQTANWLSARGIAQHILRWEHAGINGNILARARQARRDLIAGFCHAHGITHVLTGHHQGDVAENLLLRLERGSGLFGLAAMPPVAHSHGIYWVRPLLSVPKAALIDYLQHQGQDYVRDPSNDLPRFARARIRQRQDALLGLGLDYAVLAETAQRLLPARQAIMASMRDLAEKCVQFTVYLGAVLQLDIWRQALPEIRERLLGELLAQCGGQDYPPRYASLQSLAAQLMTAAAGQKTLGGCVVVWADGAASVYREQTVDATPQPLAQNRLALWDVRFWVQASAADCYLAPLGQESYARLLRLWPQARDSKIPHPAKLTLPCVWRRTDGLDEIMAVPHLGYYGADQAPTITPHWREVFAPPHGAQDKFGEIC